MQVFNKLNKLLLGKRSQKDDNFPFNSELQSTVTCSLMIIYY